MSFRARYIAAQPGPIYILSRMSLIRFWAATVVPSRPIRRASLPVPIRLKPRIAFEVPCDDAPEHLDTHWHLKLDSPIEPIRLYIYAQRHYIRHFFPKRGYCLEAALSGRETCQRRQAFTVEGKGSDGGSWTPSADLLFLSRAAVDITIPPRLERGRRHRRRRSPAT